MLQELQGPGISARGAAFAGLNLYVLLGRGQDYAWSATSSGQDITDTYAVPLCDRGRQRADPGQQPLPLPRQCLAMEELSHDNAWTPTIADATAGRVVPI